MSFTSRARNSASRSSVAKMPTARRFSWRIASRIESTVASTTGDVSCGRSAGTRSVGGAGFAHVERNRRRGQQSSARLRERGGIAPQLRHVEREAEHRRVWQVAHQAGLTARAGVAVRRVAPGHVLAVLPGAVHRLEKVSHALDQHGCRLHRGTVDSAVAEMCHLRDVVVRIGRAGDDQA
jgi:hypothetical protein